MENIVNFTREPVIETVITPREGCKLIVRNSKGSDQEDYFVDAIEVVSFGHALFFRSEERPKSFLVPVGDYEVLEVKEARMVLKNAPIEHSIKIGGGKELPKKEDEESSSRKGRKRRSRKSHRSHESNAVAAPSSASSIEENPSHPAPSEEEPKKGPFISKLFPPPPKLIQETLGRYKEQKPEAFPETALDEPIPKAPSDEPEKE